MQFGLLAAGVGCPVSLTEMVRFRGSLDRFSLGRKGVQRLQNWVWASILEKL